MLAEASMVPIEVSCLDHFLQDEGSRRAGGRVAEIERSRGMRLWFARNGVGALCLTPAKGEILPGGFVERGWPRGPAGTQHDFASGCRPCRRARRARDHGYSMHLQLGALSARQSRR